MGKSNNTTQAKLKNALHIILLPKIFKKTNISNQFICKMTHWKVESTAILLGTVLINYRKSICRTFTFQKPKVHYSLAQRIVCTTGGSRLRIHFWKKESKFWKKSENKKKSSMINVQRAVERKVRNLRSSVSKIGNILKKVLNSKVCVYFFLSNLQLCDWFLCQWK